MFPNKKNEADKSRQLGSNEDLAELESWLPEAEEGICPGSAAGVNQLVLSS